MNNGWKRNIIICRGINLYAIKIYGLSGLNMTRFRAYLTEKKHDLATKRDTQLPWLNEKAEWKKTDNSENSVWKTCKWWRQCNKGRKQKREITRKTSGENIRKACKRWKYNRDGTGKVEKKKQEKHDVESEKTTFIWLILDVLKVWKAVWKASDALWLHITPDKQKLAGDINKNWWKGESAT